MQKFPSLIIIVSILLLGCQTEDPLDTPETTNIHRAKAHSVALQQQFSIQRVVAGLVVAGQTTDLGFELPGEIQSLSVDEGSLIQKGQQLAQLDTELLLQERDQTQARLEQIEAAQRLNRANTTRFRELKGQGFAAEQRLDELTSEADSLDAQSTELLSALQSIETRLRKSRLIAPFDGVVARRNVDDGTVVAAGSPVLTVHQKDGIEARLGAPAKLVPTLSVGQTVSMQIGEKAFSGTILSIGADITQGTLTVPVRVSVPRDVTRTLGVQVLATIPEQLPGSGFWVPTDALAKGLRGLWQVYRLKPQDDGHFVLSPVDVKILHSEPTRAYVQGDIADGQQILATGLQRLVPGQIVRLDAVTQTGRQG